MNIYDPMDRIVYRHLDSRREPVPASVTTSTTHPLPAGYANGSPRTYLGRTRRPAQVA